MAPERALTRPSSQPGERAMRVVVTGVAGFIGSHLAMRLLNEGDTVIGIDNLSSGVVENIDPRVIFHREDIRSAAIYPLFDGVDTVVHLAAKNCLADCLDNPVEAAEVNVAGTANVLEAACRAGVRHIVYADTSAEYEGVADVPSCVDRISPRSVYARSKRGGAMFCEAYQEFHAITVTTLRYFNVYGPAQNWRRRIPPLMSAFVMSMLNGQRPVIYGTGEKRRDFVYIDDVTDFNVMAMKDARTDGGVYNVGSGTNYSVNEIFTAVEDLLNSGLRPMYKDDLPGEAQLTLADIENERRLGWQPRIGLREGLERSIASIERNVLRESHSPRRR